MNALLPLARLFSEEGEKYLRVSSQVGAHPENSGVKGQGGPDEAWLYSFRLTDADPITRTTTVYEVTVSAVQTEF